jgi:hypothetical protein
MAEILFWWAVLVGLIALLAWVTDRPVMTFVGLAIFCTPIVTLVMLVGLFLTAPVSRAR